MKPRLLDAIAFWAACLCLNGILLFMLLHEPEHGPNELKQTSHNEYRKSHETVL